MKLSRFVMALCVLLSKEENENTHGISAVNFLF
jgi:hypothetical protein